MLRVGYRMPLDFEIRPVPRIIRELPPSLSAYRVWFSWQQPHMGSLLTRPARPMKNPYTAGFQVVAVESRNSNAHTQPKPMRIGA